MVQSPDHECAESGSGCLVSASRNGTLEVTVTGSLIHFLVRENKGNDPKFWIIQACSDDGLSTAGRMVELLLQLMPTLVNQGATSSFFKKNI